MKTQREPFISPGGLFRLACIIGLIWSAYEFKRLFRPIISQLMGFEVQAAPPPVKGNPFSPSYRP
jgi:hypothetical protein